MNEYDSEVIAGLFERDGWILTDEESEAEVILLNTCSVRQHAEDRVWNKLYELRDRARLEPNLIVGVCGCMAQREGQEIDLRCPHVRVICGTRAFNRLPELVAAATGRRGTIVDTDMSRPPDLAELPKKRKERLKGFVPVMRGCENYCAYCVVPYVRGDESSRAPEDILAEIAHLSGDGCREVMLLGQNVNSYRGEDRNGRQVSFAGLLRMVNAAENLLRIRFMTSHPKDLGDDLIRAMAESDKVCEHLHLPLQSGSDKILLLMNRGYTWEKYRKLVERVRAAIPHIALTTDILVGFPGETREDFERTISAVELVGFDSAFMFKYSDRKGTRAFEMGPKVPGEEIERRHAELLKLQEGISLARGREMIGRDVEVLVEGPSPRNPDRLFGRTRMNRRVVFAGGRDLIGGLAFVNIRDATPLTLMGELKAA